MRHGFLRGGGAGSAMIAFIVVLAALFVGVPIWELIVPGPFDWHIQTAAYWQGGIEALVLIAAATATFGLRARRGSGVLFALVAALYLRRHAVDAPLVLDLLYLEIVIGLGMFVRRCPRLPAAADSLDYVLAFVAGFALWSMCAWTASAFDFGSARHLQWLTLVLAVPAACGGHRPLCVFLWRRVCAQPRADRLWCGALAGWLLVLFARARVSIGSDAQWYSLRSAYVLVPRESVYEPLALVSPVYYFPKLYEVFLLPLQILRDYAVISAFSILVLLLLLLVCKRMLQQLRVPERAQLPLVAIVASLPAFANSAIDPKPDVLATLFVSVAALLAMAVARTRLSSAMLWMAACIALACAAKITAIPYAGVLVVATALAAAWPRAPGPARVRSSHADWRHASIVCGLAAIAAAYATARTWLLAGVPTIGPGPALNLWLALGFALKEPAGTLNWTNPQDWSDVPSLFVDWLFRPQALEHIIISWTGNVWLWLAAIALVAAVAGFERDTPGAPVRARWPLFALMLAGLGLAVGNRYMTRGGDGNYFLFALVPAIACSGGAAFARLTRAPRAFTAALACVVGFVLFQASYSFATGAWAQGTRAFDLDFSTSPRGTVHLRRSRTDTYGISAIADALSSLPHETRVTGIVELSTMFWLPARFEDFNTISFSRLEYVDAPAHVIDFLRTWKIDYLIMPRADAKNLKNIWIPPAVKDVAARLESAPGVQRIDDRRYFMLDLRAVDWSQLGAGEPSAAAPSR